MRNSEIAEHLCRAADEGDHTDQQRRALRRAARAALRWAEEAAELLRAGRPLTELRYVGPWLARVIGEWLADPPISAEPPPLRQGFLTRVEAEREVARTHVRVRGDLQAHTLGSDGTASIAAMAAAAADRGHDYLAITDHSKGLAIARGMDEQALARQGAQIRELNETWARAGNRFRLLRAVEMNLSPNGAGDLDPDFLASLDLVLGAFHSRLRLTADQTDRYVAALRNPALRVLAHPRGRIFNFRLGLHADWPRVFACAREADVAIEIDAYPDRQDVDGELLRLARDAGVRISLGSDAHAPEQLDFLVFGVAAASAAGIPEERILNCMRYDDLIDWARRR